MLTKILFNSYYNDLLKYNGSVQMVYFMRQSWWPSPCVTLRRYRTFLWWEYGIFAEPLCLQMAGEPLGQGHGSLMHLSLSLEYAGTKGGQMESLQLRKLSSQYWNWGRFGVGKKKKKKEVGEVGVLRWKIEQKESIWPPTDRIEKSSVALLVNSLGPLPAW